MNESKMKKVEKTRNILDQNGLIYDELQNGHFKIDGVNYWATTEKWWCQQTSTKGVGINSFLKHLKSLLP